MATVAEPSANIELYQPGGETADFFGLPSASPFVTKLHVFLRAARIP
jgi:hypothetical protein